MKKNTYVINIENQKDYHEVEALVRESFWNVYRPGCMEHYVLHKLRSNPDFIQDLDFVMKQSGRIIGQNVFVKATIMTDLGTNVPVLTMGPICISPDLQRKGYGKILLDYSLQKAAEAGFGAVCFEGNIEFYGKSGFTYASSYGIRYHGLPDGEDASFFLCKELIPDYLKEISGEYSTPSTYFVCENDPEGFEIFESKFPYKEKISLPGQIFN